MLIDDNYKIHISPQVDSNYYRQFDGKSIRLPKLESQYPSKEALMYKEFEFRNE